MQSLVRSRYEFFMIACLAACAASCQHAKVENALPDSPSILSEVITPFVLAQSGQSVANSAEVVSLIFERRGGMTDSGTAIFSIGDAVCRAIAWCCTGKYVSDVSSALITHQLLCRVGLQFGVLQSVNFGYDVMYESDVAAAERVGDLVTATGTIVGNQALYGESGEMVSICRDGFTLHLIFIPESWVDGLHQRIDTDMQNAPLLEHFGCLFYTTGASGNASLDQERIKKAYGISRSILLRCD
jgi:hypothetical protein